MLGGFYLGEIYPGQSDRSISVTLSPDSIALSISIDNTSVVQNVVIASDSISHTLSIGTSSLLINSVLDTQDISSVLTIDSTSITQNHIIASTDISLVLTTDGTVVDPFGNMNYTYEDESTLGSDDTDLSGNFTIAEKGEVETDDDTFFDLEASDNAVKLFKYTHTNSTDTIEITWKGKTTLAPSTETVYLQIYNNDTSAWETLQSDGSTAADTEFTLTGSKTSSLTDYYQSDVVTARIYQVIA